MSAELGVILFTLFGTSMFFALPFLIGKFSDNIFVDLIVKRGLMAIGIYLLVMDSAIVATIAAGAGLTVSNELFQYMWIFGMFGYLFLAYFVLQFLFDVIKLYKWKKEKERNGEE